MYLTGKYVTCKANKCVRSILRPLDKLERLLESGILSQDEIEEQKGSFLWVRKSLSGCMDVCQRNVWQGGKKRKRDYVEGTSCLSSKRADKEDRTDSVAQQLRELHKDKYSGPQLRLRARMKVNGKNDSIDSPPSIPFFCGATPTKIAKGNSLSEALTSAATAVVSLLKETPEPT